MTTAQIVISTSPIVWEIASTRRTLIRFPAKPPRKSPVPKRAAVRSARVMATGADYGQARPVGPTAPAVLFV